MALLCLLPPQDPPPGQTTTEPAAPAPRAPRKGAFAPGELSDDAKQRMFDALSGKAKRDTKNAAKTAAARRREWLEGLEKDHAVYDVATIADNGDPARRVDIVIVSAGFPKSEAARVNAMAESLKNQLLKVDPFHSYAGYLNFHRVNVADAGPASAHIPYRVVNSLLGCDTRRALEYAEHAPAADLVVVLCNTAPCRATSSGSVITIDPSLDMGRTFLHEMGHAFGRLLDEYVEQGNEKLALPPMSAEQEETIVNVTSVYDPKKAKWHYWLPETWNAAYAPHKLPSGHKPGCFPGGGLFALNAYRPESACLMNAGDKYCVVCLEEMEKQFYRLITPIDDARPRKARVGLWADEAMTFEADVIQVQGGGRTSGEFRGQWYVDGRPARPTSAKNLTTTLTLQAPELGAGQHEVALQVDFTNSRVRRDHGWLSGARSWIVDVSKHRRPVVEVPAELKAAPGKAIDVPVRIENPDPAAFRFEVADLPEGAAVRDGRLTWTPGRTQQGGWRPRLTLTDGLRSVVRELPITVEAPEGRRGFPPLLTPTEPVAATAGETLELAIDAVDVDGDALVFSSPNLPEGAELDAVEGVIRWKPAAAQAGRHAAIAIEAWDGTFKARGTIEIVVEENALLRRDASDTPSQLRSPSPRSRAEALRKLGGFGRLYRFLECSRLLRDRSSMVRAQALESLRWQSETTDEAFLGMMVKVVAPYAWAHADDLESLAWLASLAAKGKGEKEDLLLLKGSLKAIEKYDRERGLVR